jgi:four helix bundle protein
MAIRHGLCTVPGMNRDELEARSQAFAVEVITLCSAIRGTPDARRTADQLQDAATSAASNYRASSRSRSRAEFVAKLGIVAEEIDESVYWLEILAKTNRGDAATVNRLLQEARELRSIFAASYRTARRGRR